MLIWVSTEELWVLHRGLVERDVRLDVVLMARMEWYR
jgi:hypothetical protein